MDLNKLERPVFLVDKAKVLRNLDRMAKKVRASGLDLRPHCKTHQSAEIADWMKDFGVRRITVSSVDMAEYFAGHGWRDIVVAVPVNIHQIPRINSLAKSFELGVIVDSEFAAVRLGDAIGHPLAVWIEIDTGYHRTGLPADRTDEILDVARTLGRYPVLHLKGILTHDGGTYHASGPGEIMRIHAASLLSLQTVKAALAKATGRSDLKISMGDTPSCSIAETFSPSIDELRPGNFVFYDLTQKSLGACRTDDIAGAAACPVISKNPDRGEVVLYGGSVHLGREACTLPGGSISYGEIAGLQADAAWTEPIPGVRVVSLSQEHGKVHGPRDFIDSVQIGDTLIVLPVHSCITASLYSEYHVLGDGTITRLRP